MNELWIASNPFRETGVSSGQKRRGQSLHPFDLLASPGRRAALDGDEDRGSRRIWLFDRRDYWRERSASTLAAAGFRVEAWGGYAYPPDGTAPAARPSLVILGCTQVGASESCLVQQVVAHHHRLVVLASALSAPVMRALFLAGAEDVTEMPGRTDQLLELVAARLDPDPEPSGYEGRLHARAR